MSDSFNSRSLKRDESLKTSPVYIRSLKKTNSSSNVAYSPTTVMRGSMPIVIENYNETATTSKKIESQSLQIKGKAEKMEKENIETELEELTDIALLEKIPEPKRVGLTNEEIMNIATRFATPDESLLFHAEEAIQKNVLIVGKAGVGKTTLFQVLKNVHYQTPTTYSFYASSGPKNAICVPLVFRNQKGDAYSISFIDTPGIYEVPRSCQERQSNDKLKTIIQECITSSVTNLSAVLFLVPLKTLNEVDIQVLNVIKSLLGDAFKKNTMLIFTHADQFQFSTLADRLKEFISSEVSIPFLNFCQGGIHFSGAVNGEMIDELGKEYETKVRKKVTCFRQSLLEAIISKDNMLVDFSRKEDNT